MASSLFPVIQFFDDSGAVLAGGKVYHYEPNTTTARDVYPTKTDADNTTNASAQPVVLDSAGRPPSEGIWLTGLTKIVIHDADDNTIDTIDSSGDASGTDAMAAGHIDGLTISIDSGDSDHDINVTAGEARDGADSEDMTLASEITKQIDAAWAVGDDAGGLDTGSVAASTDYYVWLIKRTDTDVVDVLMSLSATTPTMPTNYDKKVLIGKTRTDGSSNVESVRPANRAVLYNNDGLGAVGWELIQSLTASASSSLDFITGIDSTYDHYMLVISELRPATDGQDLKFRTSTDGGSTFRATNEYQHGMADVTTAGTLSGSGGTAQDGMFITVNGVGNAADETYNGVIEFFSPDTATTGLRVTFRGSAKSAAGVFTAYFGAAELTNGEDVDAVQLVFAAGNITSGTASLYGLRK